MTFDSKVIADICNIIVANMNTPDQKKKVDYNKAHTNQDFKKRDKTKIRTQQNMELNIWKVEIMDVEFACFMFSHGLVT